MNMYDIARETGFSIATVSRAINNSGYVSEKTREKIMKVIDEKGYSVNPFAKGMATASMSLAGVISTDSRDHYQAECIYHLQDILRQNGFTALLSCTGMDLKDKQEAVRLLLSRNVDAIFLIGSQFVENSGRDNMYLMEAARKVPVIMMNGYLDYPNVYCIRCDDRRGQKELTQQVIQGGARKPLLIIRRRTYSTLEKIRGYEEACQEAGLPEAEVLTATGITMYPQLAADLAKRDFDALLCADDELAVAALKYCRQNGLRIPEDVQITGYNNSLLSDLPAEEITSYDNRIEYLCTSSVLCMKQILEKKSYPSESVYTGQLNRKATTRMPQAEENGF